MTAAVEAVEAPQPTSTRYTPPLRRAERNPQLDGLRCWAVLAVVWYHAGPQLGWTGGAAGLGHYAVWLFFTLSAYLITGILLRLRDDRVPLRRALVAFHWRRVLRIVPPYAVVAVAVLALPVPYRAFYRWPVALFYANWVMLTHPVSLAVAHFWSLAVEEQFYLVWPLLVLWTPARKLPVVLMALVAVAVVSKVGWQLVGANAVTSQFLTTSNLDVLGLGALLAWHRHTFPDEDRTVPLRAGLIVGLCWIALTMHTARSGVRLSLVGYQEGLAMGLVSVWLIDRAARNVGGVQSLVLAARPVVYLGTVSYAVYLVQSPVNWLLVRGANEGSGFLHTGSVRNFVIVAVVSIALASLSWIALERPAARLKRLLPYSA